MNDTSQKLETAILAVATSLKSIRNESSDVYKVYFATGADALVSALAANGTAATVTTKLTKSEIINGITFIGELNDFFDNAAVAQGDYLQSLENLINGSDQAGAALSNDVEAIGTRLKELAEDCVEVFKQAKDILKAYSASELSAVVSAISTTTVVFGCSTTKAKLSSGITLVEQFKKMINNEAVTTGDYSSTVSSWVDF